MRCACWHTHIYTHTHTHKHTHAHIDHRICVYMHWEPLLRTHMQDYLPRIYIYTFPQFWYFITSHRAHGTSASPCQQRGQSSRPMPKKADEMAGVLRTLFRDVVYRATTPAFPVFAPDTERCIWLTRANLWREHCTSSTSDICSRRRS